MSDARTRILERLRSAPRIPQQKPGDFGKRDEQWLARQPPLGDLADRFQEEQEKLGSKVIRVPDWEALPQAVAPWFREYRIASAMTGEEPRLEPLRAYLADRAGTEMRRYSGTLEEQREEIFSTDCGITTSRGGIVDIGTVLIVPSAEEPRLLSLAMPIHLVVVETGQLFPSLGDYLATGEYQSDPPTNLVLIAGASRTADIELTLTVGVHGPGVFLVALVG